MKRRITITMIYQIINKILVKEDGIYVSYQNSHSPRQFDLLQAPELTTLYISDGRKALDRKILEMMLSRQIRFQGKNQTLKRYLSLEENDIYQRLNKMYLDNICSHKEIDESLKNELLNNLVNIMNPTKKRTPDRL